MHHSKAQILATIGPASFDPVVLRSMLEHQMDAARMNLAWGTLEERRGIIKLIRDISSELNKKTPIILDLPGPRIQNKIGHTHDRSSICAITPADREFIKFAAEQKVEYVAVSFVCGPEDINLCRQIVKENKGTQKVIAKIERKEALHNLKEIIESADGVMVARGDLGDEIPMEQLPFVQNKIIRLAKEAGKPVIVATEMMYSMISHPRPTRAEVTDVANAILQGADAVMLSEESARGKYPIEAVKIMERIISESEKHLGNTARVNPL
ncbi:MAG TPA: pyruvate kinase [Candidatus Paceibacterota bacterium]|nr:pyruvate kinase [Candidatus Paceibacterota bacterium]